MEKIRKAQRLKEKIEYYHEHAGSRGYSQAIDHFDNLGKLMSKANRSNKYKNDVPIIRGIYVSAQKLMDEMKEREGKDTAT